MVGEEGLDLDIHVDLLVASLPRRLSGGDCRRGNPVRVPARRHAVRKHRLAADAFLLVGKEGLEPSRLLRPADFKSAAYTNSATRPELP
jgi:hypothetical protein